MAAGEPAAKAAPEGVVVERELDDPGLLMAERLGGDSELAVELDDGVDHLRPGHVRAAGAELGRKPDVSDDSVDAGEDDQDHQSVGEGVDVPAELEAGVERGDDEQGEAEIDVGAGPGLQGPAAAGHRPLAKAEQGQPEDEEDRDRPERVAVGAAAVGAGLDVDQGIAEQGEQRERDGNLEPKEVAVAKEALMACAEVGPGDGAGGHHQPVIPAKAGTSSRPAPAPIRPEVPAFAGMTWTLAPPALIPPAPAGRR
jgi:hypothetical protein